VTLALPAAPPAIEVPPLFTPAWGLVFAFFLVFLNGFFVAAEFALVKVRPTQIETEASGGDRRAKIIRRMLKHLDAYLSATQLGITLTSLALGWIGEPAFAWVIGPLIRPFAGDNPALLHSVSITVSFMAITILHIVLGEQAPKSIAIRKAEATSLNIAWPLHIFYKVTYPLIWALNHAANALLRLVGIQPATEGELAHDEEELRLLLSSHEANRLPSQKRELLDNVFELSHRVARQIMLPRQDVVYLSTTRPLAENLRLARRTGHTRFPLCDDDLDHVIGLVHIKDLFHRDRLPSTLKEIARDIAFVPETLELDRLLKRMRTERFHLAAVIDEYGGVSGIVTLENVIEEIVGSIQDEFDVEKPELVERGDGVYQVSGGMLVEDLEAELGLELSERDEDTIGGVVLSELGRNPAVGDKIELGPAEIEVVEVHFNRVSTVRVTVQAPLAVKAEED
jgi:CBS domain containing-hemolysin-like protein